MSIEISSTDGIPEAVLLDLVNELPKELEAKPADYKIALCSVEPPAWFTLIADLDWWVKILGGYAAIYLASIANAAGKETWEKRSEVASYLHRIAQAILDAKRKCRKNTHSELAISLPESAYEAKLFVAGEDAESVADEIALFVHYAPEVVERFKQYQYSGKSVSGDVFLKVLPDHSIEVNWRDSDISENIRFVLSRSQ